MFEILWSSALILSIYNLVKIEQQKNNFLIFSTKTYVVGTQKNRLIEEVLLSTQNICQQLWVRKYLQFHA